MITNNLSNYGKIQKSNNNKKLNKIGFLSILILSLAYVQVALLQHSTISVIIRFCLTLIIATIFLLNLRLFKTVKFKKKGLLLAFGFYGVIVAVHSIIGEKSYQQWSYLVNVYVPFLLLPFFCILAANALSLSKILRAFLTITIPLSVVYLIIGPIDKNTNLFYINYISVVYLLIVLLPFLSRRWQVAVVLVSIASFSFDLDNRSNMLSIFSSYCFVIFYYLTIKMLGKRWITFSLNSARKLFLFGPIVLLILGVLGLFNIFKYIDEQGSSKEVIISTESGRVLSVDSRTGIYEDALNNLQSRNDWLFGSGATVMYETQLALNNPDYDAGRLGGSESGFLALLTFGGLTYVALMFAICVYSSYFAISQSNNILLKFLGVFIAFRWLFLFIETPLNLNFTWVTFFLAIGMAFNPQLRSASDIQIKNYLRNI